MSVHLTTVINKTTPMTSRKKFIQCYNKTTKVDKWIDISMMFWDILNKSITNNIFFYEVKSHAQRNVNFYRYTGSWLCTISSPIISTSWKNQTLAFIYWKLLTIYLMKLLLLNYMKSISHIVSWIYFIGKPLLAYVLGQLTA